MTKNILNAVLVSALLGSLPVAVLATPTATLSKRWTDGQDCSDSSVDAPAGVLFGVASDGSDIPCSDIDGANAGAGARCYISEPGSGNLGRITDCPGDPAPKKNPDGTDAQTIGDGLVGTWCAAAIGAPAPLDFANQVGCLLFGYYAAGGDPIAQAEAGASGVCDAIFAGTCTWFKDVAPAIASGMDKPCTDDPGSNACSFANPGRI